MNHEVYLADEDLRQIEKAVYEITESHGNKVLDGEYVLEKLFERGFSFKHLSKQVIKKKILNYLRKWTEYWLERFSFRNSEIPPELNIKLENIQLLKQFIKLAPRNLSFLLNFIISIAVKSIKEPAVLNFLLAMNKAIFTPSAQDLERLKKPLPSLLDSATKDDMLTMPVEEFQKINDSLIESQDTWESINYEENIKELPYLDRFLYCIDKILLEYQEASEEQIGKVFEKFQINLDEASISELTRALNYVAISAIERIINEDEYMGKRFNNESLDEMYEDCQDLEDIESKDCQLARLYYYWILAQEGYSLGDLKVYTFLEGRIKFNNLEKNLIELLKRQIDAKKAKEKERMSMRRKLRRKIY